MDGYMVVSVGGSTDWTQVENGNIFNLTLAFPNRNERGSGTPNQNGRIDVVEASYGANCDSQLKDNYKQKLVVACNQDVACTYMIPADSRLPKECPL